MVQLWREEWPFTRKSGPDYWSVTTSFLNKIVIREKYLTDAHFHTPFNYFNIMK